MSASATAYPPRKSPIAVFGTSPKAGVGGSSPPMDVRSMILRPREPSGSRFTRSGGVEASSDLTSDLTSDLNKCAQPFQTQISRQAIGFVCQWCGKPRRFTSWVSGARSRDTTVPRQPMEGPASSARSRPSRSRGLTQRAAGRFPRLHRPEGRRTPALEWSGCRSPGRTRGVRSPTRSP